METIEDISRRLTEQGYLPGAPSVQADSIDRQVCAEFTCPNCGKVGLDYVAFHKLNSYRPFIVCAKCDYAVEF